MPITPGGTKYDDDELDSLFRAVGFVVVQWGQAEQSLDIITAILYQQLRGKQLACKDLSAAVRRQRNQCPLPFLSASTYRTLRRALPSTAARSLLREGRPLPGVAVLYGLNVELCLLRNGWVKLTQYQDRRSSSVIGLLCTSTSMCKTCTPPFSVLKRLAPNASRYSRTQSMDPLRFAAIHLGMASVSSSGKANNEAA
jgi:hypothetical protein